MRSGSMGEDRHAVSGHALLIEGHAVSWSFKHQEIVSLSTTESEYVAATHGPFGSETSLSSHRTGHRYHHPIFRQISSHCAHSARPPVSRAHCKKHIDVCYHWIRWVVEEGVLRLVYCPIDDSDMVADALTKALPSPKVKHFAACLGLRA
jgi:hypothetical protein